MFFVKSNKVVLKRSRIQKLLVLLVFTGLGYAALMSSTATASTSILTRFFTDVTTLQAHFEQTLMDETGMLIDRSAGTLYLSRPGKFRWDYRSDDPELPLGQQLLADGRSLFMYNPELEQVTQRSLDDALGQVPSLFLVQEGHDIEAHFKVNDIGLTDGLSWVALQPKDPDSGYQQLMVGFLEGTLSAIELLDGLGNTTRLSLSSVEINQAFAEKTFSFTAPQGTDILVQ